MVSHTRFLSTFWLPYCRKLRSTVLDLPLGHWSSYKGFWKSSTNLQI